MPNRWREKIRHYQTGKLVQSKHYFHYCERCKQEVLPIEKTYCNKCLYIVKKRYNSAKTSLEIKYNLHDNFRGGYHRFHSRLSGVRLIGERKWFVDHMKGAFAAVLYSLNLNKTSKISRETYEKYINITRFN